MLVFYLCGCAGAVGLKQAPGLEDRPPSKAYPALFERVATTDLYEPKDWADAELLAPMAVIEAAFARETPTTEEELEVFTRRYFAPPAEVGGDLDLPEGLTLKAHIEALWPVLTRSAEKAEERSSLLPLPNRYIVPGGRFREAYYWDTYFTMLGLVGENYPLREDVVANFAAALERYGRIPNGNRSYYLSRSQPPFFFLMVGLLDEEEPEAAWARYLGALKTEHRFWTEDAEGLTPGERSGRSVAMADGSVLQRYYDDRAAPRDESYRYDVETAKASGRAPGEVYRDLRAGAESGWDFSSRWFADEENLTTIETTTVVPVDLNALLFGLEQAIAQGCGRAGEDDCAEDFAARARARRLAIGRYLWNPAGYFDDYDLEEEKLRHRPTAAMLYPLFVGAAGNRQTALTLATFETVLLAEGGVVPTGVRTKEQWDAPNGWAPHQWIAVEAARRGGRDELAEELAGRWLASVARGYCESGKLVEKYDVVTQREGGGGEYPNQDGFGWTNGVTFRLLEEFPGHAHLGRTLPRVGADGSLCAEIEP